MISYFTDSIVFPGRILKPGPLAAKAVENPYFELRHSVERKTILLVAQYFTTCELSLWFLRHSLSLLTFKLGFYNWRVAIMEYQSPYAHIRAPKSRSYLIYPLREFVPENPTDERDQYAPYWSALFKPVYFHWNAPRTCNAPSKGFRANHPK